MMNLKLRFRVTALCATAAVWQACSRMCLSAVFTDCICCTNILLWEMLWRVADLVTKVTQTACHVVNEVGQNQPGAALEPAMKAGHDRARGVLEQNLVCHYHQWDAGAALRSHKV